MRIKHFIPILSVLIFCMIIGTSFGEDEKVPMTWCPKTLISDNKMCLNCHVMSGKSFRLKEFPEDAHIKYPTNASIVEVGGKQEGTYEVYGEISNLVYDRLSKAFDFFLNRGINKVTIEIYSYGGDLFAAWRIKGLIENWIESGGQIDTKVYGGAVSAAAILFAVGQERIAHAQAEIMFHELWTFSFFEVSTPSDTESKAKVLRHLQDNITSWLASRCDLTKEELDSLMKKKEYWLNGKEAFEIGLATKLIGE